MIAHVFFAAFVYAALGLFTGMLWTFDTFNNPAEMQKKIAACFVWPLVLLVGAARAVPYLVRGVGMWLPKRVPAPPVLSLPDPFRRAADEEVERMLAK